MYLISLHVFTGVLDHTIDLSHLHICTQAKTADDSSGRCFVISFISTSGLL